MKRENNYDLLRIVCTIAVIFLHVSSSYMYETELLFVACMYRGFVCFAVPCFLMLSGAFLVDDERNKEYTYFYKKTFHNLLIPTLIFSLCYVIFEYVLIIYKDFSRGITFEWLEPIKALLKGEPYYHMWYMYMLIIVYILIPVVLRVKEDVGEKNFAVVTYVFFPIAVLSGWTMGDVVLKWNIGYAFCLLGYLMVGFVIRNWALKNKSNLKGFFFIVIGIALELIIVLMKYIESVNAITTKYSLLKPLSPIVVISSIMIFAGFSLIKVKRNFGNLPHLTFYIYLFHAGVWKVVDEIVSRERKENWDIGILIVICSLIVFVISYILSIIYNKIWKKVEVKIRV